MSLGIRVHDNPLRIWVPSETRRGREYLVQLDAYNNNGECQCEHFYNRCGPELKRGALPGTLLRCNHIERARDFFIGEMLKLIAQRAAKQPQT